MVASCRMSSSKLDRAELRRQRAIAEPGVGVIVVRIVPVRSGLSAGRVHLDGVCEGAAIGTPVEGWIALPGVQRAFAFYGEVLRTDPATGNTVVRFDEIEAETAEFLDQAAVRRLH